MSRCCIAQSRVGWAGDEERCCTLVTRVAVVVAVVVFSFFLFLQVDTAKRLYGFDPSKDTPSSATAAGGAPHGARTGVRAGALGSSPTPTPASPHDSAAATAAPESRVSQHRRMGALLAAATKEAATHTSRKPRSPAAATSTGTGTGAGAGAGAGGDSTAGDAGSAYAGSAAALKTSQDKARQLQQRCQR